MREFTHKHRIIVNHKFKYLTKQKNKCYKTFFRPTISKYNTDLTQNTLTIPETSVI